MAGWTAHWGDCTPERFSPKTDRDLLHHCSILSNNPICPPGFHQVLSVQSAVIRQTAASPRKKMKNPELVPLHRIDRLISGLIDFSKSEATRTDFTPMFEAGAPVRTSG